jgi:hypothetical protein
MVICYVMPTVKSQHVVRFGCECGLVPSLVTPFEARRKPSLMEGPSHPILLESSIPSSTSKPIDSLTL